MKPLVGLLLACQIIWADSFPVNAPHQALFQEVVIALCPTAVTVETRIVREVQTPDGPVKQQVGEGSVTSKALRVVLDGEGHDGR